MIEHRFYTITRIIVNDTAILAPAKIYGLASGIMTLWKRVNLSNLYSLLMFLLNLFELITPYFVLINIIGVATKIATKNQR